jgi:hypothetical protein
MYRSLSIWYIFIVAFIVFLIFAIFHLYNNYNISKEKETFTAIQSYKNVIQKLPYGGRSAWRDTFTQNEWKRINERLDTSKQIPWKALSVDSIQNISFSFWIYFLEEKDQSRDQRSPLFSITSPSTNKEIFSVTALPKRPILDIRSGNKRYDPYTHNSDMTNGNEIGYNHSSTFVIIVINNDTIHLYLNGECKNKIGGNTVIKEPNGDSTLVFGGFNQQPDSIYLKDFRVYNHSIPTSDIAILYQEFKQDGYLSSSIIESFESEPYETFISRGPLFESFTNLKQAVVTTSSPVQVQAKVISLEDFVLRSETEEKCNTDKGGKTYSNFQNSPVFQSANIDKAFVSFNNNSRKVDFTQEIKNILQLQPKRISIPDEFGIENNANIEIELIHPWTKKKQIFKTTYSKNQPFLWENVVNGIKCLNSDGIWDYNKNTCTSNLKHCTSNNFSKCINYFYGENEGKCSAENTLSTEIATITLDGGIERKISFISLDSSKKEYLDMSKIKKSQEQAVLFSPEGTSILFWVKIDPSIRKSNSNWARLLNFGNRHWKGLEDDVGIAINADTSRDGLIFYHENNGKSVKVENVGTQILDNQWHHIAWVLSPGNDTNTPHWNIYHNGFLLKTIQKSYPVSKDRNVKMLGGSAFNQDAFWSSTIGEFRIYNTIIDGPTMKNIYRYGITQ